MNLRISAARIEREQRGQWLLVGIVVAGDTPEQVLKHKLGMEILQITLSPRQDEEGAKLLEGAALLRLADGSVTEVPVVEDAEVRLTLCDVPEAREVGR